MFAATLLLIESSSVASSTTSMIPPHFSIGICFPSLLSWSLCYEELHSEVLWYEWIFTFLPYLCFCPFELFELQWKHCCQRFDLTWFCVLLNVPIKPRRRIFGRVAISISYWIQRDRERNFWTICNSQMCLCIHKNKDWIYIWDINVKAKDGIFTWQSLFYLARHFKSYCAVIYCWDLPQFLKYLIIVMLYFWVM